MRVGVGVGVGGWGGIMGMRILLVLLGLRKR